MVEATLHGRIASFLKLRDESIRAWEADDSERIVSANAIVDPFEGRQPSKVFSTPALAAAPQPPAIEVAGLREALTYARNAALRDRDEAIVREARYAPKDDRGIFGLEDDLATIDAALSLDPKSVEEKAGPVAWCQPMREGQHSPRVFVVRYEDQDVRDVTFDNEADARAHWEKANVAWNCYLLASLPLNRELSALEPTPPSPEADGSVVAWRTEYRDVYQGRDTGWHHRFHETEPSPARLTSDGCGHRNVEPLVRQSALVSALRKLDEARAKETSLNGQIDWLKHQRRNDFAELERLSNEVEQWQGERNLAREAEDDERAAREKAEQGAAGLREKLAERLDVIADEQDVFAMREGLEDWEVFQNRYAEALFRREAAALRASEKGGA